MTNLTNFRVKLNLSKFYNDVKKLSFIYLDTSTMSNVLHLHLKIANIFGITKKFYLTTENNIFLPLIEDIRIIKENDIITVIPESTDSSQLSVDTSTSKQTVIYPDKLKSSNVDTDIQELTDLNTNIKKKRRRVRRNRQKNKNNHEQESEVISPSNFQQIEFSNISNDIKLNIEKSTPKHLKFNSDDEFIQITNNEINKNVTLPHIKPTVISNETTNLSSLLNLKNNPVPVTYSSKRVRKNSENSHISHVSNISRTSYISMKNNKIKMETSSSSVSSFLNSCENKIDESIKNDIDFTKINPLNYPIYESSFEIDDIIAFRTLKIGDDYSPTVSGFIIAKIYAIEHDLNDYVFKIIDGYDQIKIPDGKFTLPYENNEDEYKFKEFEDELINLNSSYLVEPRLLYRVN